MSRIQRTVGRDSKKIFLLVIEPIKLSTMHLAYPKMVSFCQKRFPDGGTDRYGNIGIVALGPIGFGLSVGSDRRNNGQK